MLKQKYLVGAIVNQTNIGTVAHMGFAERIGYHHDLNGNGTERKGSNKNTWHGPSSVRRKLEPLRTIMGFSERMDCYHDLNGTELNDNNKNLNQKKVKTKIPARLHGWGPRSRYRQ